VSVDRDRDRDDEADTARAVGLGTEFTLIGRAVLATIKGKDLALAAAGLTFYAGIALVPLVLLSLWSATLLSSPEVVLTDAARLRLLVPPEMGARPLYDQFVAAGVALGPLGALVALFPATFYGEGVRRACLRLVPHPEHFTGWRARIALLPLLLVAPAASWALLGSSTVLAPLAERGGVGASVLHVALTFHLAFLVGAVVLAWAFRFVAPGGPSTRAAITGGLVTSAVLAGFLHGAVLFLALPIDLGVPFGGFDLVGAAVATALWLLLFHVVVLLGWVAMTAYDRRLHGAPTGAALDRTEPAAGPASDTAS
jgi:membrane protein